MQDEIVQSLKTLVDGINDCEMLLIGIGDEWKSNDFSRNEMLELYNVLAQRIEGKNYFVVTSCEDGLIYNSALNKKRVTAPFYDQEDGEKQWEFYNKWLSTTLNHKLLMLELGEGFDAPNVIRWPFENVTFINDKAKFIRVNKKLYNVPENISSKSLGVLCDSVEFAKAWLL